MCYVRYITSSRLWSRGMKNISNAHINSVLKFRRPLQRPFFWMIIIITPLCKIQLQMRWKMWEQHSKYLQKVGSLRLGIIKFDAIWYLISRWRISGVRQDWWQVAMSPSLQITSRMQVWCWGRMFAFHLQLRLWIIFKCRRQTYIMLIYKHQELKRYGKYWGHSLSRLLGSMRWLSDPCTGSRALELVIGTILLIKWSIWSICHVQRIQTYGWSQWWDQVM